MIYINKYTISQTHSFEKELKRIYRHIAFDLKEPRIAEKFYDKVKKDVFSLQYFPERYIKISNYKNRNLRRLSINKFVVIYEVNNNTSQVNILHIFHNSQNYLNQL